MDSRGRSRHREMSWIIAASAVILILGTCQGQTESATKLPFKPVSIKPKPGQSGSASKPKTTTTTTTTEAPVEESQEDAQDGESSAEAETKPPLTGDPRIDYVWDPNLPRELNGFNLSHYPFYSRVPSKVDFDCTGLIDGFYANVEHHCQVYHQCLFGQRYDFLCANYTAFDQKIFNCHFANEVDCVNSPKFYDRNEALYKTTTTTTSTLAPEARRRWRENFNRRPPTAEAPREGDAAQQAPRRPSRPSLRLIDYDYYYDDDYYYYYDDVTGSESDTTTTTTTTTTLAPPPRRPGLRRRPGAGGPRLRNRFRGADGPRRRPAFDYDYPSDPLPPPKKTSTANSLTETEVDEADRTVANFRNTGLAAQFRPKLRPNKPVAAATDSQSVTVAQAPSTPVQTEAPLPAPAPVTAAPARFGQGSQRRPTSAPNALNIEFEAAPIAPEVLAQAQNLETVSTPARPANAEKVQISIGENLEIATPPPKRPPFRPPTGRPRPGSAPSADSENESVPLESEPEPPKPKQAPTRITSRVTTTPAPVQPEVVQSQEQPTPLPPRRLSRPSNNVVTTATLAVDFDEFVLTEAPVAPPAVPQRPLQRPASAGNARPGPQFVRFDPSLETERTAPVGVPGFRRGPQAPPRDALAASFQPSQEGQGSRRGPQSPQFFRGSERESRDIRLSADFSDEGHPSEGLAPEASSSELAWFPLNIYELFNTKVR